MINLLPPQQKKEFLQEESWKLVLILGSLAVLFLISLSLILFSVKIYILGEVQKQKILVNLEEKIFKASEFQNLEEELNSINQNLLKLNSFYKSQPNFTELLAKVSETLPEETYLINLSLGPAKAAAGQEEGEVLISLTGYSPTRELLFEFKKRLESELEFKEVYFPPINWAKPKDIDFSTTFQVEI